MINNKDIYNFYSLVSFAISLLLLFICIKNPQIMDRFLLLEYTHPVYWENFSLRNARDFYYDGTYENIFDNRNLFRTWVWKYENGETETRRGYEDDSLIISGKNEGDHIYFHLTDNDFSLPVGYYTISNGVGEIDNLQMYIESTADNIKTTYGNSSFNDVFRIESMNEPMDVCLNIRSGFQSEGIKIYPRINGNKWFPTKSIDFADKEDDELSSFYLFELKDRIEDIPYEDYKLFLNNLAQYEAERITIIIDDIMGIVYNKDDSIIRGRIGKIDRYGDITETVGFVYDMEGYLALGDENMHLLSDKKEKKGINGYK